VKSIDDELAIEYLRLQFGLQQNIKAASGTTQVMPISKPWKLRCSEKSALRAWVRSFQNKQFIYSELHEPSTPTRRVCFILFVLPLSTTKSDLAESSIIFPYIHQLLVTSIFFPLIRSIHDPYLNFRDDSSKSNYVMIGQRHATLISL
jgi:hypothetical protein